MRRPGGRARAYACGWLCVAAASAQPACTCTAERLDSYSALIFPTLPRLSGLASSAATSRTAAARAVSRSHLSSSCTSSSGLAPAVRRRLGRACHSRPSALVLVLLALLSDGAACADAIPAPKSR